MRRTTLGFGLACTLITGGWLAGQEPAAEFVVPQPGQALAAAQPKQKEPDKKDKDKKTAPPAVDLSELPAARAEAPTGLNPHMIGDLGLAYLVTVRVPSLANVVVTFQDRQGIIFTQNLSFGVNVPRTIRVPVASRGGFKIAENETVLPQDRAFFTYNYYNNLGGPSTGSEVPRVIPQNFIVETPFGPMTFPGTIQVPGLAPPRFDLHRETVGFEKTFFDGAFSLGMRVPIFQQNGDQDYADHDIGDMTFIAKYAPFMDRESGSGISVGLAVTAPTGPSIPLPDGDLHSTLIQPFLGYQYNRDRFLLFGFTSVAIPTDDRDVTLMFNDIGLGYRLWEGDGLIRSCVPAVEAHVTTPLDHRGRNEVLRGIDVVVLTGGLHVGVGQRSLVTFGVATPVTGPRPFDVEGIVQFNWRF